MVRVVKFWTVVGTKQPSSRDAVINLRNQGFEYYRPLYRARPNAAGVRVTSALFAYYLFVRVGTVGWDVVRSTRGVAQMYMSGDTPARIADSDIEYFRSIEDDMGYCVPPTEQPPRFERGQVVDGIGGLFEGNRGTYQGLAGSAADRVRVLFNILGRKVAFEVSAFDLTAAA